MKEWSEKKDQNKIELDKKAMNELKSNKEIDSEKTKKLLEYNRMEVEGIDKIIRQIMSTSEKEHELN